MNSNTVELNVEGDILIVEDSLTQAEQLRFTLEEHGYRVRHARNGREAILCLASKKPLLIITDINMPEMDGYELCRAIRSDDGLENLPVILLTSLGDPEDVVRGLECGADNFLTKPYDDSHLLARVGYILSNHHLRTYEKTRVSLEVFFGGKRHLITADRLQILNLLLSTYETAVIKNHQLEKARIELQDLNAELEARVQERTQALSAEYEERMQAERRFRTLLEAAPDAMVIVNHEGEIVLVNSQTEKLFGYAREELLDKPVEMLIPEELRSNHTAFRTGFFASPSSRTIGPGRDLRALRKDKTEFPAEISLSPLETENGILIISTIRDISEKKKLEAQSLRAQRLESIGALAGGIAHDLNNMLAPILMSIDILRLKYSDQTAERILATIETSARRGADMVKQILTFSRGLQGVRSLFKVDRLLVDISKLLKQTFPKSIEVRTAVEKDLWPMIADATQIHQVIMNLCINARDAMPDGGLLKCEAANCQMDETLAAMHPDAKAGRYVVVCVSDTGTGMPKDVCDRIFEPFFTTKPIDKGTGLGLSTTLGIVKSHGGFLTVSSEQGKGTVFKVYLPAQISSAPDQTETSPPALLSGDGEWVLVVDDEASILNIAKQTLETFGFHILTASDGVEAATLCSEHLGKIKMMITDVNMPIMDGTATIRAVRKIDPRVRIVIASGLITDEKMVDLKSLNVDAFLLKPFTTRQLVATVHDVLKHI